ncbi:MAG: pilus assembly protein TadG-related protein, partial [Candidatus Zixiibacteriota bacterium]
RGPVSMVALFAFAVLAIDMSLIQLAKNQLQNAADAAALAAAIEYGITYGDASAAVNAAIDMAGRNRAIQTTQQPVIITEDDVSFPGGSRVRVQTHRTEATADPVRLYFMRVLSPDHSNRGNVHAVASAEITPVGSTTCLKPWMFPDKWDDVDNDSIWDPGEYYDPDVTGYRVPNDVGTVITLKYDAGGSTPKMGWYQPIRFGPVNRGGPDCSGADCYRTYIYDCEPYLVAIGDTMEFEMGNMVGPTRQGWSELHAMDPDAYYNAATGTIENSAYSVSPRLIKVAMYDPTAGVITSSTGGSEKYTVVTKIGYLFIEAPPESGSSMPVTARFIRYASSGNPCPECPEGFLFTARLVE